MGVNTELEYGKISSQTNVTGDDPILTFFYFFNGCLKLKGI
jgi:hypothetical protein